MQQLQHLLNPTKWRSEESSQTREEHPTHGPHVWRNDEESDLYEEPQERKMRVLYKLKVNEDPASKNMPHEEEFDDDN